jgi:putative exporter of polyketide antibiotics
MLLWAILAVIALRILIPRWQKRPPNRAIGVAVMARGIQPTGPGGIWTRGDHLRAVNFSGTIALALAAVTVLASYVEQLGPNGSTREMISSGVMLIAAIGLVMAVLIALFHLVKAPFSARAPAEKQPDESR